MDSGTFPNYSKFTIVNESAGSYIFDREDYEVFEKWNNVITSLPDQHEINNTKISIRINRDSMDSINTLGYTQMNDNYYSPNTNINYTIKDARIVFNKDLVITLKNQTRNSGKSTFYYMFLHEMGHAFGIGALFDGNNLQSLLDGTLWYTGINAVREYNYYFLDSSYDKIPIENNGGIGTENVSLE